MVISIDPATAAMTLLIGIGLVILGWRQIGHLRRELHDSSETSAQQISTVIERSYAALLPQIDQRFDSPYINEARNKEWELIEKVAKECEELPDQTKEQHLRVCCEKYIEEWWKSDKDSYFLLMRRCQFFEMVGFMCNKGYLDYDDIADLYGMPILRTYMLCKSNIEKLRHGQEKVYEHFVELANRARKFYPTYQVLDSL